MKRPALRVLHRIGLQWLVWLALVMPVSQAAAYAHALTHLPTTSTQRGDDLSAPAADHCELCLVAATVGGGALPSTSAQGVAVRVEHVEPVLRVFEPASADQHPHYLSRAPPSTLR